jgi:uncharacterized protein (TIGR02996 family)
MGHDDAFIAAIAGCPDDIGRRLVYADWLEERGHAGAEYLRAEAALARANEDDAGDLRRRLLGIIPGLPSCWRDRFEQPDLLLAPPVQFPMGWYAAQAERPSPYRSLSNLEPDQLSPDLPWLQVEHTGERGYAPAYQRVEAAALPRVRQRAHHLGLALPPGFESLAEDFPRRLEVSTHSFEFFLLDAADFDFPKVTDGYLVRFFGDMDYGDPHQRVWCLYLVPNVDWHCVVAYELPDEDPERPPENPDELLYCAPSFQAFLYRWWLDHGRRQR